jgi:hypothetical protein
MIGRILSLGNATWPQTGWLTAVQLVDRFHATNQFRVALDCFAFGSQ